MTPRDRSQFCFPKARVYGMRTEPPAIVMRDVARTSPDYSVRTSFRREKEHMQSSNFQASRLPHLIQNRSARIVVVRKNMMHRIATTRSSMSDLRVKSDATPSGGRSSGIVHGSRL
jgi:hypothetical protein